MIEGLDRRASAIIHLDLIRRPGARRVFARLKIPRWIRKLFGYLGRKTTNERVRCRQTESTWVSFGSSELTIFL